jgi:predicted PurR-regulated permease PerM
MVRGFDEDRGRLVWWGFGAVLGGLMAYIAYRFVGTLVFGVFLYYATRPVYKRVSRRVDQPSLAAAASLTLFLLPSMLLVTYTLVIAYVELKRYAGLVGELARSGEFGKYEGLVEEYVGSLTLVTQPEQLLAGGGVEALQGVVAVSITYLGTLLIFALHLFVIVAIAFYLLRDDERVVRWFTSRFADDRGVLGQYLTVVDKDFNNIFFGNILNAVLTGAIGTIVYTMLNFVSPASLSIPNAALVGMLTGIASLVPVVGMKLVYVPLGAYLFALPLVNQQPATTWFPVTFVAVSFVVVDTIPDLVLRPYVSGRSLHMGALMLAYVLGPLLFGWYGLFLLPMVLVLVVHFARIVLPELVAGEPLKPYAVDPTYVTGDSVGAPAAPAPTDPGATDGSGAPMVDAATAGAAGTGGADAGGNGADAGGNGADAGTGGADAGGNVADAGGDGLSGDETGENGGATDERGTGESPADEESGDAA